MADITERRPRREGGAQDDHHGGGNVSTSIDAGAVKGPRCKYLHPKHLTGCKQPAEPRSNYCARHSGGAA